MLRFGLFVGVILAAGLAAYGGGFWLMNQASTLTLVDAAGQVDQQKVLELLKLVPPAMAALGAIVTAGASVLVVGLQKRANADLENLKGTLQRQLEERKSDLAKDLEVRKTELARDLETEKRRLDLASAEIDRRLEVLGQAEETASSYVALLHGLDSGKFEVNEIEKMQPKLTRIADSLGRESPLYFPLCALIGAGNYLKERAEECRTAKGWQGVWRASHPDSGQPLGTELAARKDALLKILQDERKQVLSKMV